GVSTLKELVDLAKAKPDTYAYASTSTGASPHLAMEMFVSAVGIKLVHVPYKGQGPAVVAILCAQTPYAVLDATTLPLVQSGKLKALAVTSPQRWAQLPNVPTIAEFGVPGYECINWSSILAPAGTPREIVRRINATVANALKSPDVKQRLNSQGFEPSPSTPEELEAFLTAEVRKYAKVIADAGIKVD
ncbi:MAG: tripartite tricarboxylate transporter substrate binding protein, partial [Betaproteobacteria bacterium]|nr:tripartite tricarboxylate transporter substrate binding protein [Betaproteobacteria bacterium]